MGIEHNKHPNGRLSNMAFGLCSIADGLVRLFSFGFLHSTCALDYSRYQAKSMFRKLKKERS